MSQMIELIKLFELVGKNKTLNYAKKYRSNNKSTMTTM